jgi:hypothetical protein
VLWFGFRVGWFEIDGRRKGKLLKRGRGERSRMRVKEVAEAQMSCGQARCLYIGLLSVQLLRRLGVPERATPREFCAKVGWLRSLRHTVPTSRQIGSLELTDDRAANGRLLSLCAATTFLCLGSMRVCVYSCPATPQTKAVPLIVSACKKALHHLQHQSHDSSGAFSNFQGPASRI